MRHCFNTFEIFGLLAWAIVSPDATGARAGTVNELYADSHLTISTPGLPGESNYRHAVLFSKFLRRHIPGRPRIVVNMKKSSRAAANFAHDVMPRDGRHLLMPGHTTLLQQFMNLDRVRYDAREFVWLGMASQGNFVLVASRSVGIQTVLDLRRSHMIVAVTEKGSSNYILPKLARELLGLRMTLLRGHGEGQTYTMLAVKNEILKAGAAFSWEAWQSTVPHWFRDGTAEPILQTGYAEPPGRSETAPSRGRAQGNDGSGPHGTPTPTSKTKYYKHPDLSSVPLLVDLVSDQDRPMIDLIWSQGIIGHGLALPPGVAREKVVRLRASFAATMQDPEYLAMAKKQGFHIRPMAGEVVERSIREFFAKADGSLAARARHLLVSGKRRHK